MGVLTGHIFISVFIDNYVICFSDLKDDIFRFVNIMDDIKTKKTESVRPRPKRIVLIASERTFIEYPIFLRYLLVALVDESIPVMLVCPPGFEKIENPPSIETVVYPAFDIPFTGHFNRKILFERMMKFRPTMIHCLCDSLSVLARRSARAIDISYLINVNSLQKRYSKLSISSRRASKIIVPAESIGDNIRQLFQKNADQVVQINMGCFVDENNKCFSDTKVLPSLLVADELDEVGRYANLLSAVRHLILDGYEFMLVIMGKGQGEDAIRDHIRANKLSDNVIVVPKLESERFVVRNCDIYIQLWPGDSYNAMIIEAMASGAAVAASSGGVDDMLIDGENCVLFEPSDQLSIRSALKQLLDKHDYARKLASNAIKYVKKNHSMSKMIGSILDLYS